jgi:PmbA protein
LTNNSAIAEITRRAVAFAQASKQDADWQGFPSKKPFPRVENTYDDEIVSLRSEELVNIAAAMLDSSQQSDKRVLSIEGGAGASSASYAVANSNGVEGFDSGTIIECSLATIASEGTEVTPVCFEFDAERNRTIDPQWVGKEAARLAASALKAQTVETKSTKVVLTQFALQQLLHFTLINAIDADAVQRNQSALKGKIGEKIAAECLTIYDDGLLEHGLMTSMFDGEGVPHQKTLVIENGVLKSYLYDNYTAKKDGVESTGNAGRAGYLSTPDISPSNFHLLAGEESPDELLMRVDDGLLVSYLQGAHSSNPVSGEFSVVATPAWKIRNGKIVHSVKGAMVAGNMFEVLKNISALANNERKLGSLVAPWVLAENIKVIGK